MKFLKLLCSIVFLFIFANIEGIASPKDSQVDKTTNSNSMEIIIPSNIPSTKKDAAPSRTDTATAASANPASASTEKTATAAPVVPVMPVVPAARENVTAKKDAAPSRTNTTPATSANSAPANTEKSASASTEKSASANTEKTATAAPVVPVMPVVPAARENVTAKKDAAPSRTNTATAASANSASANTEKSATTAPVANSANSASANTKKTASANTEKSASANTQTQPSTKPAENTFAQSPKAETSSSMPPDNTDKAVPTASSTITETDTESNKKTKNKPAITFNYGVGATWVNRVKKQTGRSNFVFNDFLAGAYFTTELRNLTFFDIMLRVAAYYPLSYTFNKVPQAIAQPLAFGFDGFIGVNFKFSIFDKLYIDLAPGAHVLYQMSDRFNFIDLGIAAMLGLEFPLSSRWTILMNGFASFDYGNLGTNMYMEPYDFVWQYQASVGVRYSKRVQNPSPYIKPRQK